MATLPPAGQYDSLMLPGAQSPIGQQQGTSGSQLKMQNSQSADMVTANNYVNEIINLSGAGVVVYLRTNNGSYDDVWDEDPAPVYYPGINMKGFFVPKPVETSSTKWGIDAENSVDVIFSKVQVMSALSLYGSNRMIRPGDVIEIPYGGALIKPLKYLVTNARDAGMYKFQWFYWACMCKSLHDDIAITPVL